MINSTSYPIGTGGLECIFWMYIAVAAWTLLLSFIAIGVTRKDKNAAQNSKWRVKEATLMLIAFLGGAFAMIVTMRIIRHKTNRKKFMVGIPLIILFHIAVLTTISLLYFFVWR